jgi:hypothetical protein
MVTAAECREYAHECARWAAEAKSDEMRQAFLDMANHFLAAALELDGLITPQTNSAVSGTNVLGNRAGRRTA